jgi:anti-sigma B factor antagonist
MPYETLKKDDYSILMLTGDIDMSSSTEARKQILDCLAKKENVMVDLSKVSYIDSSGVASLVEGFQTAKSVDLNFYLIGVSEAAMMVIKLARLDKVFPIYDTFELASKSN